MFIWGLWEWIMGVDFGRPTAYELQVCQLIPELFTLHSLPCFHTSVSISEWLFRLATFLGPQIEQDLRHKLPRRRHGSIIPLPPSKLILRGRAKITQGVFINDSGCSSNDARCMQVSNACKFHEGKQTVIFNHLQSGYSGFANNNNTVLIIIIILSITVMTGSHSLHRGLTTRSYCSSLSPAILIVPSVVN